MPTRKMRRWARRWCEGWVAVLIERADQTLRLVSTYLCANARLKNDTIDGIRRRQLKLPFAASSAQNSPLRLESARRRPATGTAR